MKLNIIIITILLICSCENKKTGKSIYYKTPNGTILTSKVYDSLKIELSKHGKLDEVITSTIERGDSIIKSYKITVMPIGSDGEPYNPFGNAEKLIGKKLPFNSLTTIKGELLNIDDLKGKPTLINFWFTACKPCIEEIPELNSIKENYKDSVNFLAITFDSKEKVSVFLKKIKFNFLQVVDSKNEIDKIGDETYPMNIFLDKDGVVQFVRGNLTEKDGKDFKSIIDKLL